LIAFGAYYLARQFTGAGHGHFHFGEHAHGHEHHHAHPHEHSSGAHGSDHAHGGQTPFVFAQATGAEHVRRDTPAKSRPARPDDRAVVLGLLVALTFSPCEAFLPVFLAGALHGWVGYVALSLVLALATGLGMMLFTSLALKGLQHLELRSLERYENGIAGALLVLMGLGIWAFEAGAA